MRKRFFAALTGVVLAAGMLLAGGVAPAHATCQQSVWGGTVITAQQTYFNAVASTLTITSPNPSFIAPGSTNHWVGISDSTDNRTLVQAGYDWYYDNNTGGDRLKFWYEFWPNEAGQDITAAVYAAGTPAIGDPIQVELWYNASLQGWGLAMTDESPTNSFTLYSHYVYPDIHGGAPTYSSAYEGAHAEIITEVETGGQLRDGTETYKHSEAQQGGIATWSFFENIDSTPNQTNTINWNTCKTIETNIAPNSNAYAYQTWYSSGL